MSQDYWATVCVKNTQVKHIKNSNAKFHWKSGFAVFQRWRSTWCCCLHLWKDIIKAPSIIRPVPPWQRPNFFLSVFKKFRKHLEKKLGLCHFCLDLKKKHRKSLEHRKNLEHSQIQKKSKANMTKSKTCHLEKIYTWTRLICDLFIDRSQLYLWPFRLEVGVLTLIEVSKVFSRPM